MLAAVHLTRREGPLQQRSQSNGPEELRPFELSKRPMLLGDAPLPHVG